jgi:hypothetical protein
MKNKIRSRAVASTRNTIVIGKAITAGVLVLATAALQPLIPFAAPAQAQAPAVQIEVVPNAIALASEREANVLVIARNPSKDALRKVRLSYFTAAGVSVFIQPPAADVLSPYGALTWNLLLSQEKEEPAAGTVHLRLDYLWARDHAEAVPCVAHGALEITPRRPETAEEVVAVTPTMAEGTLMENRPATIYLKIENKSDVPLKLTNVLTLGPDGVSLTVQDSPTGEILEPTEIRVVKVTADVSGSVWSGKHLLLFDLAFERTKEGRVMRTNRVITHEVTIGVLGESGLLKLLGLTAVGVPSFLFLPGLLIVMTVRLLHRRVAPPAEGSPLEGLLQDLQDRTKPEFWFVVITISLPVTLLYPVVTRMLGSPRNPIRGYALSDVMWIWGGSIVLGCFAYFSIVGLTELIRNARRRKQQREEEKRIPASGDDPIEILRKLHRQGLRVWLARVAATVQGKVLKYVFLLQPRADGQETIWIGPRILVRWKPGAEPELKELVSRHLTAEGNAAELADLLVQAKAKGPDVVQIDWEPKGALSGPYPARVEDITNVKEDGSHIGSSSIVDIGALLST